MKESRLVSKREIFSSEMTGGAKRYTFDTSLWEFLGQAKSFFLHGRIHAISGGTSPTITCWFHHSCIEGVSPALVGEPIQGWDFTWTGVGSHVVLRSGGHAGFCELVVEIADLNQPPGGMVKVDMELYVTAIVEE
jgi:hypothetical protein